MGTRYLIDSNVIIAYLDNKLPSDAMERMNHIVDDCVNISVINKIEILRYNTLPAAYDVLQEFVDESNIFGLDDKIVVATIAICKAHRIKLPDAIIAATAIINDLTLLTRNTSDFKNIEGLLISNPWE